MSKEKESLNDRAMRALVWMMRAEMASKDINDFGDATAIREDMNHLERDALSFFDSIERRAWDLTNRCDKFHEPTGDSANE